MPKNRCTLFATFEAILLLVWVSTTLHAQPSGKMMLTPEEAQDGWISLFDGESLFRWGVFGDGDWKVADGNIVCEEGRGGWLASSAQFADFELLAKVRVQSLGAGESEKNTFSDPSKRPGAAEPHRLASFSHPLRNR